MSFKAKLKVAGKELYVLGCSYALKQKTDAAGRSSSITRSGKSTTFFDWLCNNFERKYGSIIKRDNNSTHKELAAKEACLV